MGGQGYSGKGKFGRTVSGNPLRTFKDMLSLLCCSTPPVAFPTMYELRPSVFTRSASFCSDELLASGRTCAQRCHFHNFESSIGCNCA
eukprot:1643374-Amphidinium_carterae.1